MRQTLSAQAAGTKLRGRCMTSASKSLDLLRLNIQTVINKEIDAVLKKYLDTFFKPAVENIRNNLGENSVTEDNIRIVCRQILEDAKVQYYSGSQSRGSSPYSDSETGSVGRDYRFGQTVSRIPLSIFHNKRKESDTESEASQSAVKPRKKTMRTGSTGISNTQAPVKVMKVESIRRESPKWDPNRIVKSTLFIMGARANKVLGFGQTRGRLYTKHPELLKYSGDAEDKEWLSRHNLIPPTGGIAYLLILEDVKELAESEEYRHNPNVILSDLKGFKAPDFMLKKIRAFVAQARSNNGKEQVTYLYSNDANDQTGTRFNYNVDCASVIMTPPATVLGSAPGTPCESLDLGDCSGSLLATSQPSDFLTSGGGSLVYDNAVYTDVNKTNQSFLYGSDSAVCGTIANNSTLASLLVSPMDSDSLQEKV
ncbi:hypothetical protein RUM44_008754 [Polyplax serrata]|uniref:DNTTIP1 dimerisation domain-containing protein n=1 Tax=Polyplax serrata TaxID=468196 RepID=A0ABR1BBA8_POLSC